MGQIFGKKVVLIEKCFFIREVFHQCMEVWERFQKKGGSNIERCFFISVVFISVVSHQGGLSSGWYVIKMVSDRWSLIGVVFHWGGLSSGWSAIGVVCHCGGLSPGWSVIWTFFHQDDVI